MDRSSARAYVYAKASGMLAKSYIGARSARLFAAKSLRELYGLLFADEVPSIPETLLAKHIEQKAERVFVGQFIGLLAQYSSPDEILVTLLRSYDYENIKEIGAALCYHETAMPDIVDIGDFSMLSYRFWPDIAGITSNSPVAWYNAIPAGNAQHEIDLRLDRQYIMSLWHAAKKLPLSERADVLELVKKEISYQNIMWALRLKVFYRLSDAAVAEKLVYADELHNRHDDLAREALAILDRESDRWDAWSDWKYADFLNPHEEGSVWEIDPCWVENMMRRDLAVRSQRTFHRNPDSVAVLYAWFKIKQHELQYIRSVAEGLRLNVDADEVMTAAGATAVPVQ